MNSGMYSALSGNLAAMKKLEVISNNLANINTPGYKKDNMLFETMLAGTQNPPAVPQSSTADPLLQQERVYVDYSPGQVAQTGNSLDFAIDGDGFFAISTPDGPAYTRQGNFRLNANNKLVTVDGYPVMGQGGSEITIQGSMIEIDSKGEITVDGQPSSTIRVVDFPKPYNLTKTAGSMFVPTDPQVVPVAAKGGVAQGQLEGSNVNTIAEMVQMIETNRYFEACSKVVKGFDDIAAKAANELGKL